MFSWYRLVWNNCMVYFPCLNIVNFARSWFSSLIWGQIITGKSLKGIFVERTYFVNSVSGYLQHVCAAKLTLAIYMLLPDWFLFTDELLGGSIAFLSWKETLFLQAHNNFPVKDYLYHLTVRFEILRCVFRKSQKRLCGCVLWPYF